MASRSNRLSEAADTVQELQDEIMEWREKLEGTNLENTEKYQELQDCEDALQEVIDSMQNVEFPGAFGR